MTVKELIQELMDQDMDSEVSLQIKLADMDLEYDTFEVEMIKLGGGWGRKHVYLSVDLEHETSGGFIKED
jgi:hypothetical protein